ncbi:MAG: hypothetical protein LBK58_05330, partial [Prevotellaceae bacterium]|nr:hypothetical protein [Prevotellaceae bacterium]
RQYIIKQGDSTVIDVKYKPVDTGYTEKHLFLYVQHVNSPVLITMKGKIKNGHNKSKSENDSRILRDDNSVIVKYKSKKFDICGPIYFY